jgi:hypothetical protein
MVQILWKLFQEMGGEYQRTMEGVNLTMLHCKNFCKCHNVTPAQQ